MPPAGKSDPPPAAWSSASCFNISLESTPYVVRTTSFRANSMVDLPVFIATSGFALGGLGWWEGGEWGRGGVG